MLCFNQIGGQMEQIVVLPNNTSGVVFVDGWAEDVEGVGVDTYRWTTSVTARIKIPVISRASTRKSYQLKLSAFPYQHPNGPAYQDVGFFLDGYFLTQLRLDKSGVIEAEVFLPALNPSSLDAYSILSLVLPDSAVPANYGDGSDLRELGIGMRRLELKQLG